MEEEKRKLKWFAIRLIREKSYVLKYLECRGVESSRIEDIKFLHFVHCTESEIEILRRELFDKVLFYRDPQRRLVEPIPDNVMQTFLVLAPFHDTPVFYLPVDDSSFFQGQRKRVTKGLFAGCEGVIKRIRGERRLIIRISDKAAVATPYIPVDYMENI